MGSFAIAKYYTTTHLVVQPADLRMNPPESYLYVQDGLIISCGVLYALCYFFYAIRTYKDRTLAGPVEYPSSTMAYELFYAFATTSTAFERLSFLVWFFSDIAFVATAITSAYAPGQRNITVTRVFAGVLVGLVVLKTLVSYFPDDREQLTAFWAGVVLQLPISVGSVWLLIRDRDLRGHSLEIWLTRYLGCYTAYGLFGWRYLNVPENWEYVASWPSIAMIGLTLLAETLYPFVYVWVWMRQQDQHKGKIN